TCLPCNSSARRDRTPALPESGGSRRALPFLQRFRWCNRGIVPRPSPPAKFGTSRSPSLHLLNDLLQLIRHRRDGFAAQCSPARRAFRDHDIEAAVLVVFCGVVVAKLRATTFFSLQPRSRNQL